MGAVPVIDLANFPAELEKLAAAVSEMGCFRVVNHGMPAGLGEEMREVSRSLFEIPMGVKLLNVNERLANGSYVPPAAGKLIESFGIYNAASPADVHSFCTTMQLSQPHRKIISEYLARFHEVTMKVACKVAESLGLRSGDYSFEEWTCDARLHRYNFKSQAHIGSVGLQPHTDTNFLTILQEDASAGGLEINYINGRHDHFVAVNPQPESFLAFIGDSGKAWSNGRMRNLKHRVICKEAFPRISIVMFLLAPKDDRIEAPAALIDSHHPKLYRSFIYTKYRSLRFTSGFMTDEILLPLLKADLLEQGPAISTALTAHKLSQSISNIEH